MPVAASRSANFAPVEVGAVAASVAEAAAADGGTAAEGAAVEDAAAEGGAAAEGTAMEDAGAEDAVAEDAPAGVCASWASRCCGARALATSAQAMRVRCVDMAWTETPRVLGFCVRRPWATAGRVGCFI